MSVASEKQYEGLHRRSAVKGTIRGGNSKILHVAFNNMQSKTVL